MADTAWLDAVECAALVRRGEVSPAELVDDAIARIEKLNPALDAVIRTRYDEARAEAAGTLPDGPFRGVPILLKDLGAHVAGEVTAHGFRPLQEVRRQETSYVASLLQAAGFVVLGRTNVPQFGTTVTTEAAGFPPARNPWNPEHSTGGSSGGSAAAVASGMVPVAHANDGGGSIRIPASSCGLVGLKPSRGRVSNGPSLGEEWAGGVVQGALTRTVRDAAAVLDVLSVPMPGEPYYAPALPGPLSDEVGKDPGRLRIGFAAGPPQGSMHLDSPECRPAVTEAARLLESLGHLVEESFPDAMFDPNFVAAFGMIIAADIAREVREYEQLLGRAVPDEELEPRNVLYRGWGASLSAVDYLDARVAIGRWSREMASWWTTYDVLVTPVLAGPPPPIGWFTDEPGEETTRLSSYVAYTAQFNMTGQPAVSLPLSWTASGLPVGVQLVAPVGREDLLVRLAARLEQAAPWADRRPAVAAPS